MAEFLKRHVVLVAIIAVTLILAAGLGYFCLGVRGEVKDLRQQLAEQASRKGDLRRAQYEVSQANIDQAKKNFAIADARLKEKRREIMKRYPPLSENEDVGRREFKRRIADKCRLLRERLDGQDVELAQGLEYFQFDQYAAGDTLAPEEDSPYLVEITKVVDAVTATAWESDRTERTVPPSPHVVCLRCDSKL
mgnify:CR=1 FL=1